MAILDARYYDPQALMNNEVDDFLSLLDGNFGAGKAKVQKLRDAHDITQRVFGNLRNIVNEVNFGNLNDRKREHHEAFVDQIILDSMITRVISSTFDYRTDEKLNQFKGAKNIKKIKPIKLVEMLEFLEQEFQELARRKPVGRNPAVQTAPKSFSHANIKPRHQYQSNVSSTFTQCYVCNTKGHCTLDCRQFLK